MKTHNTDAATARILSKQAYKNNGGSHPKLEDISTLATSASNTAAHINTDSQPIADAPLTISPSLCETAAQSNPETMDLVKELENMPDLLELAVMATLGSPASTSNFLDGLDSLLDQHTDQQSTPLDNVEIIPVQSQDPFMGCTVAPTAFATLDDAIDFL